MQEVVKRMQERQKAAEPLKKIGPVNLCMVSVNDVFYPVMVPNDVYLDIGDQVVFCSTGAMHRGTIVFFESYRYEDDSTWTLMTVTAGMTPIKAIEYYRKNACKWEEKE